MLSYRSVVRDSYFHHSPVLYPAAGRTASPSLSPRRTTWSRTTSSGTSQGDGDARSGVGNVIGYNYFEDGFIGSTPLSYTQWMEVGMNART